MTMLEPQLEHNRAEDARLVRRKRQFLVGFVLSGVALAVFVPERAIGIAIVALLATFGVAIGYLELKRTLLFRRDLRERRQLDPDSAGEA